MTAITRQKSRKGSKKWRKNIDMTEIEDMIEAKTVEEMTGSIRDKENAALFLVDVTGNSEETAAPAKKKKTKVLTVDQILSNKNTSKVGHLGRIKHPRKALSVDALLKSHGKKIKSANKQSTMQSSEILDIWADKDAYSSINPSKNKIPIHPGSSYNPNPEEHQELLKIAIDVELKQLEKESIGSDIRKDLLLKFQNADADVSMDVKEDSESDSELDSELNSEPVATQVESPKVLCLRKRKSERNKEKREKELRKLEQKKAETKKLLEDVSNLEVIKPNLEKKQVKQEQKVSIEKDDSPVVVCLSDELPSSLRELRPEGNLLKELYGKIQNKLGLDSKSKRKRRKRRYELKQVEKHAFKRFK